MSLQKAGIEKWMDGGGCGGKMARHTKNPLVTGILLPLHLSLNLFSVLEVNKKVSP